MKYEYALFYALDCMDMPVVKLLVEHSIHISNEDILEANSDHIISSYLIRVDKQRRRMPFFNVLCSIKDVEVCEDKTLHSLMKVFQNDDLARYIRDYF